MTSDHRGEAPGDVPARARFRQRVLFPAILLLLVLTAVEGTAMVATSVLAQRHLMAYIPSFTEEQIAHFFRSREPRLGWGPRTDGRGLVTTPTPRNDPAFPADAAACISAYGDSFTYGEDAAEDESYSHHLAVLAGCRVANYGLGGYGSDQAMMLHHAQRVVDSAPTVLLGHLSENILRNVNQYRQLLYPGSLLHFKPRLVVAGDSLAYVPIPITEPADFVRLREHPGLVLRHEGLIDRPRRGFPHTVALARWAANDFKVRAKLAGEPYEAAFYAPDHPAGGLELTIRVLQSFVQEARARGQDPLVLLIPTLIDIQHVRAGGAWPDQPLSDRLRAAGVPILHLGPVVLQELGGADPCSVFGGCTQHHFDSGGNAMIARAVWQRLQERHASTTARRSPAGP